MNQKQIQKYKSRVDYLARYISENSVDEKIKYALEREYNNGNFYDVPLDYYFEDPIFVARLKEIFFESDEQNQRIPFGIFFNMNSIKYLDLLNNIIYKIRKGINIDVSSMARITPITDEQSVIWGKVKPYFDKIMQKEEKNDSLADILNLKDVVKSFRMNAEKMEYNKYRVKKCDFYR